MSEIAEIIKKDTDDTEKVKQEVAIDEEQAQRTADEAKRLKDEAQKELSKAEPELVKALKSLNDLDPKDIAQIKT